MLYALFDGEHPLAILVNLHPSFRMLLSEMQPRRKWNKRWRCRTHFSELSILFFVQAFKCQTINTFVPSSLFSISGEKNEEGAEEGSWSGQVQAAVVFTRVIKCQEVDEQIHLYQIACAKLAQRFKELVGLG